MIQHPHNDFHCLTDSNINLGLGYHQAKDPEDEPLRPHWLHQHYCSVTWWLIVCFQWQGRHHHAVGLERRQASVLSGSRRCDQLPCVLPQPLLAVCSDRQWHQDLGPWEQVDCRWTPPRIPWTRQEELSATMHLTSMVCRWTNPVLWIHWPCHSCVASHSITLILQSGCC